MVVVFGCRRPRADPAVEDATGHAPAGARELGGARGPGDGIHALPPVLQRVGAARARRGDAGARAAADEQGHACGVAQRLQGAHAWSSPAASTGCGWMSGIAERRLSI